MFVFLVSLFLVHQARSEIFQLKVTPSALSSGNHYYGDEIQTRICSINGPSVGAERGPPSHRSAFNLAHIDGNVCTHLMLHGVVIEKDGRLKIEPTDYAAQIATLREKYPQLKVILSVGNYNARATMFQEVSADPNVKATFLKSLDDEIRNAALDGVGLAWMWPGIKWRSGRDTDRQDLVQLARSVKDLLDKITTRNVTLSILLPGHAEHIGHYDLISLNKDVDHFLILAQDYAGNWDGSTLTRHPAGIKQANETIQKILTAVSDPKKLILGIPLFGRSFLLNEENHPTGLEQPFKGSFPSLFYESQIEVSYREICYLIREQNFSVFYDDEGVGMFATSGRKWIGFDGIQSVEVKIKYVQELGLGGLMGWYAEQDDYDSHFCGGEEGKWGGIMTGWRKHPEAGKHPQVVQRNAVSTSTKKTKNSGVRVRMGQFELLFLGIFCFFFYKSTM